MDTTETREKESREKIAEAMTKKKLVVTQPMGPPLPQPSVLENIWNDLFGPRKPQMGTNTVRG